jgi:hypothetical protein
LYHFYLNQKPILKKTQSLVLPNKTSTVLTIEQNQSSDNCISYVLLREEEQSHHSHDDRESEVDELTRDVSPNAGEECFTGRISSVKLLCNLFCIPELPAGIRYTALASSYRTTFCTRIDAMTLNELDQFHISLHQRSADFLSAMEKNPTAEQQILLDIFLHLLIEHMPTTKIFMGSFINNI